MIASATPISFAGAAYVSKTGKSPVDRGNSAGKKIALICG
jgi:hypothetical protein